LDDVTLLFNIKRRMQDYLTELTTNPLLMRHKMIKIKVNEDGTYPVTLEVIQTFIYLDIVISEMSGQGFTGP